MTSGVNADDKTVLLESNSLSAHTNVLDKTVADDPPAGPRTKLKSSNKTVGEGHNSETFPKKQQNHKVDPTMISRQITAQDTDTKQN